MRALRPRGEVRLALKSGTNAERSSLGPAHLVSSRLTRHPSVPQSGQSTR